MEYPKHKYKKSDAACGYSVVEVRSEADEKALGAEYKDSPGALGIETCPSAAPAKPSDSDIPVFVAPATKKPRKAAE